MKDGAIVASRTKERGIDFEPRGDYLEALRGVGADGVVKASTAAMGKLRVTTSPKVDVYLDELLLGHLPKVCLESAHSGAVAR